MRPLLPLLLVSLLAFPGCLERAKLPPGAPYGPDPTLPDPNKKPIPTVKVATATGWPADGTPTAADGFQVRALARGLDHPRWLYVLPNGDVLVAETNAPPRPEEGKGFKGKMMKLLMKKNGSGVPSADRITLLRDVDGDGVVEVRAPFLTELHSPFGMALVGDRFLVANTDAVVSFPYEEGETRIRAAPQKVADLPAGPRNHHWTKSLVASRDGKRVYVGVGSNSNVAEHGLEVEDRRATVLEIDLATGASRVYASGLRNPVGMAWAPGSDVLWVAVNERDELGSDLVPDYMTSVKEGGFYGWPFSYYGPHVDARVKPPNPEKVAKAIVPDYALGAHTASLGLAFYEGNLFPSKYRGGAFVGQHGSWNRRPPAGYRVVFIPFQGGKPAGPPEDVLTGFLEDEKRALGRPVGVAVDRSGALLVADDVGNAVWRVTPKENSGVH